LDVALRLTEAVSLQEFLRLHLTTVDIAQIIAKVISLRRANCANEIPKAVFGDGYARKDFARRPAVVVTALVEE
jgi:hypothetical protein